MTNTDPSTNPDAIIRPAVAADMAAVQAIYADAVEKLLATWDEVAPTPDEVTAKWSKLVEAGYPYLVAVDRAASQQGRERLVGFAYAGPFHPQTGWRYTAEHSIYLAPGAQGHGLGRKLMGALMSDLRARGFCRLLAGISRPGGEVSLRFHKQLGFQDAGVFPATGYKNGQWLDAVYLQLDLLSEQN